MRRRSPGIYLLSAAFLLAAFLLLTCDALFVVVLYKLKHEAAVVHQPSMMYPTEQPLFTPVVYSFIVFLFLAGGGAAITCAGILMLKRWGLALARAYSIATAGAGLLLGCFALFLFAVEASARQTPGFNPQAARTFFTLLGSGSALLLCLGLAMLWYLSRGATKALFAPAFIPLDTQGPTAEAQSAPSSILALACLLLVTAFGSAALAFTRIPTFFFGQIVSGTLATALYTGCAVLSAGLAIGLFTCREWARLGAIGSVLLGWINSLVALLPSSRVHLAAYEKLIQTQTFTTAAVTTHSSPGPAWLQLLSVASWWVVYLALSAALLFTLHRHRRLFS